MKNTSLKLEVILIVLSVILWSLIILGFRQYFNKNHEQYPSIPVAVPWTDPDPWPGKITNTNTPMVYPSVTSHQCYHFMDSSGCQN